jgi:hypothetical protein
VTDVAEPLAVDGPPPAWAVAIDMAKRSVWLLPVLVIVSAAFWGMNGVLSSVYALGIVICNFLLAAWLLAIGGRIGPAVMGGFALVGFLLRLGLIFIAVMLVKDAAWVELVPLGITLVVTHLVLLFWEMRHVSSALAFPGLKPGPTPNPYLPTPDSSSTTPTV